jgi:F-type H+-transporting ATPase subunit delta
MTSDRQTSRDAASLWRLCLVNGLPDADRVRQVVEQVIASGRHRRLEVLAGFLRLLKRDRDERTAEVGSAAPLDEATRATVQQGLARRFGRAMATTFVVDPSLIAGIRLKAAGELFDDTVSARLAALEIG